MGLDLRSCASGPACHLLRGRCVLRDSSSPEQGEWDGLILRIWGPYFSLLGPGDQPLLEEYRVQIRLISSLSTLCFPEKPFRVQVLPAVVGMDVKRPTPVQSTKFLHPWPRGCSCLLITSSTSGPVYAPTSRVITVGRGEVECCLPSCSSLQRPRDLEGAHFTQLSLA